MPTHTDITAFLRRYKLMPLMTRLLNIKCSFLRKLSLMTGRDPLSAVYNRKYFEAETEMTIETAGRVAEILAANFSPRSLADVGCGTAVYLEQFARLGIDVYGYEGSSQAIAAARIDSGLIQQQDVTLPFQTERQYDLVICFEVAEHISGDKAGVLIGNLARIGSVIAFSAAPPGQGGADHVNEQPQAYWIEKFNTFGFEWDQEYSYKIRAELKACNCVWWLVNNLMVFRAGQSRGNRSEWALYDRRKNECSRQ